MTCASKEAIARKPADLRRNCLDISGFNISIVLMTYKSRSGNVQKARRAFGHLLGSHDVRLVHFNSHGTHKQIDGNDDSTAVAPAYQKFLRFLRKDHSRQGPAALPSNMGVAQSARQATSSAQGLDLAVEQRCGSPAESDKAYDPGQLQNTKAIHRVHTYEHIARKQGEV